MTISQDLRIRLVKKVATGISCRQAAEHFKGRVYMTYPHELVIQVESSSAR